MKSRSEVLAASKQTAFDVCVIGGGATGAGCALDARLRGLRTLLLEGGDFAGATSSASTKLVHGGVRYLQQAVRDCDIGQYRVVRRALRERKLMLENAPYLAHPLELIVPCFSRRDLYYFGAGMKLYDWMSGDRMLFPSRRLSVAESLGRLPRLNPSSLAGAVSFYDGQFDDARYGIALVKTLVDAGGAALNYARVVGFEKNGSGRLTAAGVQDHRSGENFTVRAEVFLNATGPFADQVRELAKPGAQKRLRLSKGIHILLPLDGEDVTAALLIPKTDDGRVIFAIPWLGRLLVGTTEEEVALTDEPVVQQEEVKYLLRHLNAYLTRAFTADQVVSTMAGLRPLVSAGNGRNTRALARDHELEVDRASGLISILGGKWTTYRAMAEDAVNVVQRQLKLSALPCITANYALAGASGYKSSLWQTLVSVFKISAEAARQLAGKFGTDAFRVLELVQQDPSLAAPIVAGAPGIQAEVVYSIRHEMAMSIEDVLARRVGVQWFSCESALAAAPIVAAHFAREHGWTAEQAQQSVLEYTQKLRRTLVRGGPAEQGLEASTQGSVPISQGHV